MLIVVAHDRREGEEAARERGVAPRDAWIVSASIGDDQFRDLAIGAGDEVVLTDRWVEGRYAERVAAGLARARSRAR